MYQDEEVSNIRARRLIDDVLDARHGKHPPSLTIFTTSAKHSATLLESLPMPKHSSQILQLAKRGAEVRFRELLDELKFLTLSFPHLRDAVDRDDLPVTFILKRGQEKAGEVQAARSRRKMSAKARKAISMAQKARWAKSKAETKKKA